MFYTHSHLNRPFAQYDHMVQDLPCWMANCTLGLLTQSNYTHSSIQDYFVLDFPMCSLSRYRIVQRVYYFTMYFQCIFSQNYNIQYRSKLWDHLYAVKPRLCRTLLPRIHRGGTKTATAAKTKATESRSELDSAMPR